MLLTTVVLWALNLTVTRYILTHGFEPLAAKRQQRGAAHARHNESSSFNQGRALRMGQANQTVEQFARTVKTCKAEIT